MYVGYRTLKSFPCCGYETWCVVSKRLTSDRKLSTDDPEFKMASGTSEDIVKPKALISFCAAILMATSSGCGSPKAEDTDLAKTWAKKLAPYDLVTLFPPRTMVQPGDVYLICSDPGDDVKPSERFQSIFIMSLQGFSDEMEKFFKSRMVLPIATNSPASDAAVLGSVTVPTGIQKTSSVWTALGFASFPELFQAEGSVTTAGAAAPTGFAIFGLGGQHKSLSTYVLSMPATEWAGLPWDTAQQLASADIIDLEHAHKLDGVKALYKRLVDTYTAECGKVRLTYVSEVYYTRHLTLSYGTDKSSAINAQARLYMNANQARYNVQQAASATAAASAAAPASGASNAAVNQVNANLDAAQAGALAAGDLGFPGAHISSAYAESDGVSFDYIFASPVAVGVRLGDITYASDGITLMIDASMPPISARKVSLPLSKGSGIP